MAFVQEKNTIPEEIKTGIMQFNDNEVKEMFARLEEIKRLKRTQKDEMLNSEHILKQTKKELKKLEQRNEKIKENDTGLKMRLQSLMVQLSEFDKSIKENSTMLTNLSKKADETDHLIHKLKQVKQMNE
jgi:septal ring factor EnvC (AmiA/AmiB activator)